MRPGYLTVLVLACFIDPVFPQQYIFTNYTVNDGLVANSVRRIHQDKKGFIWIGTLEGLSQYDGHRFNNYTTANGLTDQLINSFYETGNGTLYVAANDGSVVATGDNKLHPVIKASTAIINRFLETPDGQTLVTTDDHGLAEFSPAGLRKTEQPFPRLSYTEITSLNDSLFLVVNDSSLQVLTYRLGLFSWIKENDTYFTDYKLLKDSKNRIWAGSIWGLKQVRWPQHKGEPLRFLPLPPSFDLPILKQNHITALFEDKQGFIWIGTSKGLVMIRPDGSHQVFGMEDGLASDHITSIMQDRESNIWFGTSGGLSKLVTSSGISIYTTRSGFATDQLSFSAPYKRQDLLVISGTSLQVFNKIRGDIRDIPNPAGMYIHNKVMNSEPVLLLSSGQLSTVDTQSGRLQQATRLDNRRYMLATKDEENNFFLSTTDELFFTTGKGPAQRILDKRTQSVIIDRPGSLWAATWWYGLYHFTYTVSNDSIRLHTSAHYFTNERFRSMFLDSEGNIWAGTRQHGVYVFNPAAPAAHSLYNQQKGLLSDFVKQIVEDKEGNIWLAYYQGLDKLIKQSKGYRVFNFSRVANFYPVINTMDYDGEAIWMATQEGLVKIRDTRLDHTKPLQVTITRISSPDSVYPAVPERLSLGYRNNQLQFEFSSPGFINEKQLLYSYRLTGAENSEWSHASPDHSVSFANLRAGSYTFEVRGLGWNGEWGPSTSFAFTIIPPFWQTWWFRTVCALLIIAMTIWLVRRRIGNIRREAGFKHRMVEAEMAALRSQMNPHFIFNCLNAIDNLIQTNQKEKATAYLSRFAKLIRNVLDSSKSNVVPFQKDQESLRLYLEMEQFRCSNRFDYRLIVDQELLQGDYKVPPLLLQPFVENAIHHGLLSKESNERLLEVRAELKEGYIQYTVTDNGIGRTRAEELKQINRPGHVSYGIQITEERLRLYNPQQNRTGDVIITDLYEEGNPSGTKVEIRLTTTDNN